MIAHVVEFSGASDKLEKEGMDGFEERVVPVLKAQPGFQGALTMLNREQGRILGVTLWDTEENGRLAGVRLGQERHTGEAEMGATSADLGLYEVLSQL